MSRSDDGVPIEAPGFESAVAVLTEADGIAIDLRYASADNFLGRNLYGDFRSLCLHAIAAAKLRRAAALLRERRPDRCLLVFDGLRPESVQRTMWEAVRNGPMRRYVADPAIGSIHAYGFAVDLSLQDANGRECDMGTPFDDFTELSEPQLEARFLAEGRLTAEQIGERKLLRDVMEAAGFHHLPHEWWHFDAERPDVVRSRYKRLTRLEFLPDH